MKMRVRVSFGYKTDASHWDVSEKVKEYAEQVAWNMGGEVTRRREVYDEKYVEVIVRPCLVAATWLGSERDEFGWAAVFGCDDIAEELGIETVHFERMVGADLLRELGEIE
jgi:hypothetical protein